MLELDKCSPSPLVVIMKTRQEYKDVVKKFFISSMPHQSVLVPSVLSNAVANAVANPS